MCESHTYLRVFIFVNLVVSKIWASFPKKLENLFQFTLLKNSQFFGWKSNFPKKIKIARNMNNNIQYWAWVYPDNHLPYNEKIGVSFVRKEEH